MNTKYRNFPQEMIDNSRSKLALQGPLFRFMREKYDLKNTGFRIQPSSVVPSEPQLEDFKRTFFGLENKEGTQTIVKPRVKNNAFWLTYFNPTLSTKEFEEQEDEIEGMFAYGLGLLQARIQGIEHIDTFIQDMATKVGYKKELGYFTQDLAIRQQNLESQLYIQ